MPYTRNLNDTTDAKVHEKRGEHLSYELGRYLLFVTCSYRFDSYIKKQSYPFQIFI